MNDRDRTVLGLLTLRLHLEGSDSLKAKRGVLKSTMARLRNEFNISIAEVGDNDRWQDAVLAAAAVANSPDYVQGLLSRVVEWIEEHRLDVTLEDYTIEML